MHFHWNPYSLLYSLCVFSLLACNRADQQKSGASFNEKKIRSLAAKIDLNTVSRAHLITKAQEDLSNWSAFLTLKVEIENLENYSLQEVVDNSPSIIKSISDVQDSVPEKFSTPPILNRLNVLLTKAEMLQQYVGYEQNDSTALQDMGKAIFEAYENLEIQLNETYLQHYSQFDFDMDRRQDSIQQARKEEEVLKKD